MTLLLFGGLMLCHKTPMTMLIVEYHMVTGVLHLDTIPDNIMFQIEISSTFKATKLSLHILSKR